MAGTGGQVPRPIGKISIGTMYLSPCPSLNHEESYTMKKIKILALIFIMFISSFPLTALGTTKENFEVVKAVDTYDPQVRNHPDFTYLKFENICENVTIFYEEDIYENTKYINERICDVMEDLINFFNHTLEQRTYIVFNNSEKTNFSYPYYAEARQTMIPDTNEIINLISFATESSSVNNLFLTLNHELTHIFQHELWDMHKFERNQTSIHNGSFWFLEGLAEYYSYNIAAYPHLVYAPATQSMVDSTNGKEFPQQLYMSHTDLVDNLLIEGYFDSDIRNIRRFSDIYNNSYNRSYQISHLATTFIFETYGKDKLFELVTEIEYLPYRSEENLDRAFKNILGKTELEVVNEWKVYIEEERFVEGYEMFLAKGFDSYKPEITSIQQHILVDDLEQGTYHNWLRVSYSPGHAEFAGLEFHSSDPSIAEINSLGAIIAKQPGTVIITTKVKGTDLSDSGTLTIIPAESNGAEPIPEPSKFLEYEPKTNVDLDKDWTITFSHDIDRTTISEKNIYIQDSEGETFPVVFDFDETENTSVIRIAPVKNYEPSTQYELIIKDLYSISGQKLNKDVIMKFFTQ